jgi:hypothetical protein
MAKRFHHRNWNLHEFYIFIKIEFQVSQLQWYWKSSSSSTLDLKIDASPDRIRND